MSPGLEDKLVRSFPNLYKDRYGGMQKTAMCWGFSCGDGWYDLIYKLSDDLEKLILANPQLNTKASQVKEKFGSLRFYITSGTSEMHALIQEAEDKSEAICETCGKPGILRHRRGWCFTSCEEHKGEGVVCE